MTHAIRLVAAVILVAGWALPSAGQSLGEVARREEARRKRVAKPGKVYTNESLRGTHSAAPEGSAPAPDVAASAAAPSEPPPAADAGPRKDQAYWRDRITKLREGLDRARMFQEALQTRINSLTADFTSRDDPAQRTLIGNNRDKALAELARVNKEIADAEKGIRDIEEEARKAGVPPGWLR